MSHFKCFPSVYSMSKSGKIKEWYVYCENHGAYSSFTKVSGYSDGKKTESTKNIYGGKNIGKANQTTHYEQAESEAQASWQKRLDEGWTLDITSVKDVVENPMKADNKSSDAKVHASNLIGKYKLYYIQRKLNGMRCFAKKISKTTIRYTSIKGRELTTLDHLTPSLLMLMDEGMILDGELYIHGVSLNKIISYVKRKQEKTGQLKFCVYDLAIPNIPYSERKTRLESLFIDNVSTCVVCEPTFVTSDVNDFERFHDEFVSSGYEGAIIRLPDGYYRFNHRSNSVLKVKQFIDDEFIITGGHEGTGDEEGCVVFEFITKDGKAFSARPEGSREERMIWLSDIKRFIGKAMTVRFFGYTEYGIPFHPVAVCVRDYE